MKHIISIFTLLLGFTLFAQSEERFQFDEEIHDFGTVEEGPDISWRFKFKNIGKDTILLVDQNNVRPGCGCTASTFTKTPVIPGDTGSIIATFHTSGRLGSNIKNISVMYKGSNKTLMFKVVVIAKDTSKYTEAQKKKSPVFWTEKTAHDFGKVERGQKVQTRLQIKNNGKDTLKISNASSACACISYKLLVQNKDKSFTEVKALPAGKTAILELVYSPNFNGKSSDIITFATNDLGTKRKAIKLTATVVDSLQDKQGLREEAPKAPFGN